MNAEEAKKRVMASITEITDGEVEPTEEMNLIGKDARLDSMKLVELCLSLEDQAGDLGFEFDWTSGRHVPIPQPLSHGLLSGRGISRPSRGSGMIIVTGASRGLGQSVAERLISSGREVLSLSPDERRSSRRFGDLRRFGLRSGQDSRPKPA